MRWRDAAVALAAIVPLSGMVGLNAVGGHIAKAAGAPPTRGGLAKGAVAARNPAAAANSPVSYQEEIAPLLKAACSECHDADGASGDFVVMTPAALRKGGKHSGASIIVPGHADQSQLIAYLKGTVHGQQRMPMGKPALPAATIARVVLWINQGAAIDTLKPKFPYTMPVASAVPTVKNAAWCRNPIDNFVLAKMEARGVKPAPPATRVALMRRVYADLVGEPPTPQEAAQYLDDHTSTAYVKLVDRLLADPRYGERWGRHWLDLVRYAETQGFEHDTARPRAWRYRDYVIKSFNADKPYDRFLREQIAGDELYPDDPDAIVATGFARLGPWDELSTDPKQRWQDYLNDATDTTGAVMLGLTVGCARCHDHKYDRITQADYYRLQAFYASTKWVDKSLPGADPDPAPMQAKVADARKRRDDAQKQINDEREKVRALFAAVSNGKAVSDDDLNKALQTDGYKQQREKIDRLNRERDDANRDLEPIEPVAEAIVDEGAKPVAEHILLRGDLLAPGPEVKPGFVASLVGNKAEPALLTPLPRSTGARSALANWIGSRENPLTARVMVNRVWQYHFGRGIVATPSDFGINGQKPTHPELLDWLAVQFEQKNWSLKEMHRMMLLSSTYRQASDTTDRVALQRDPNNALFSRMNRIRLDGEALRDSILTVSGRLNPEASGPSVYPHVSDEVLSTGSTHKWGNSPADQELRRTVYVFQRRSLMLPLVEAFDGADMSNTCPVRGCTTIAPQALALFNGEFSRTESAHFAERVAKDAGTDKSAQIDRAYLIALSRTPTAAQKTQALAYLSRKEALYAKEKVTDPAKAHQLALADFCHVLINVNEFVYLD